MDGRAVIEHMKKSRKRREFLYLDGMGDVALYHALKASRRAAKRYMRPKKARASKGWRVHLRAAKAA